MRLNKIMKIKKNYANPKMIKIIEIHANIMKIMKIINIHMSIQKILKIIEINMGNMKIMKIKKNIRE